MKKDLLTLVRLFRQSAPGFTLLELTAVMLLLTILLGFTIPALHRGTVADAQTAAARKIAWTVQMLKLKALSEQKPYDLHLDLDQGRAWVTTEARPSRPESHLPAHPWTLPKGVGIDGILFPKSEELCSGMAVIGFYPQGYSDQAVIRLTAQKGGPMEILIEPFLPFARIRNDVDGEALRQGGWGPHVRRTPPPQESQNNSGNAGR